MKDEFKRELALKFLQRCGWDIEALPPEAWRLFKHIDHKIVSIPLLKQDYESGTKVGMLANRYRMSNEQVRRRIKTEVWVGSAAWQNKEKENL